MKFMGFAVNLMAAAKPVSTFNEWNGPLSLHGQGQCSRPVLDSEEITTRPAQPG